MVSPLPLRLHSDLEQLKAAVYDNIRSQAAFSDGILIFYGKCGNALADLEHDLSDLACPIYFLTDERGTRIEDCIALALGGNKNYDSSRRWTALPESSGCRGSNCLERQGWRKAATRKQRGYCWRPGQGAPAQTRRGTTSSEV